jgi:two-component system, response regulator PdtaR
LQQTLNASFEGTPVCALSILVVEDEAIVATLLAEVLEEMGHNVCAIEATEANAVAAAARCKPNLMIIDAGLGEGSGLSAVAEILRSGFVPHVIVSGNLRSLSLKPDTVALQKPFLDSDLALAIQRALKAPLGTNEQSEQAKPVQVGRKPLFLN